MTTFVSVMLFEIGMCMSVYCGGQVDDVTRVKTGSTSHSICVAVADSATSIHYANRFRLLLA